MHTNTNKFRISYTKLLYEVPISSTKTLKLSSSQSIDSSFNDSSTKLQFLLGHAIFSWSDEMLHCFLIHQFDNPCAP